MNEAFYRFIFIIICTYSLDGLLWIIEGFEAIRGQLRY